MIATCMDCGQVIERPNSVSDGVITTGICEKCLAKRLSKKKYIITMTLPLGSSFHFQTNSMLCVESLCAHYKDTLCKATYEVNSKYYSKEA